MKNKIFLIDTNDKGHHLNYFKALKKIEFVDGIILKRKFYSIKQNLFLYFMEPKKYISDVLNQFKYNDSPIFHFLNIDPLYMIGNSKILLNKKIFIGTLHHLPNNLIKFNLLKKFSNYLKIIIVHSDYIKDILFHKGIKNVKAVNYPAFYSKQNFNKEEFKKSHKIDSDLNIISAMGATRKDKGLDILLNSFKYISNKSKEKIFLNIVGDEDKITKKYILNAINIYKIKVRIKLSFVSDNEFIKNILISDLIVLPYRKIFSGSSGPMTEAIYNKIPVLGPDSGSLGYMIKKHSLGFTFKIEDKKDIAKKIEEFIEKGWKSNYASESYIKKITLDSFIDNHRKIYTKLLNDIT